jgi:DNA-binding Lrp family transcriptional regulator
LPVAYVLLNTEIGTESQVLNALKKIEGVEEVHTLWGVYDIIANIKADNMEKLKYIITKRIEKIGKINSKLTMIITEKPQTTLQEQVIFEQNPILL